VDGVCFFSFFLLSWCVGFFDSLFLVPAIRFCFIENGGPFSLWQLKMIQEVITLTIFSVFMLFFFKDQPLRWNHLVGFGLLILAVFFLFRK
jgi:uncharacterized protein (DUF486 family)